MPMPKLLQLFLDNVNRPRDFKVAVEGDEAEIYLYDAIGDWYGVSAPMQDAGNSMPIWRNRSRPLPCRSRACRRL